MLPPTGPGVSPLADVIPCNIDEWYQIMVTAGQELNEDDHARLKSSWVHLVAGLCSSSRRTQIGMGGDLLGQYMLPCPLKEANLCRVSSGAASPDLAELECFVYHM